MSFILQKKHNGLFGQLDISIIEQEEMTRPKE